MDDKFLKEIPKKDYGIYREKSKQAFEAMQIAFDKSLWVTVLYITENKDFHSPDLLRQPFDKIRDRR